MPNLEKDDVVLDYLETGQGTTVILIHSTVSGNRQWKTLMEDLGKGFQGFGSKSEGLWKNFFLAWRENSESFGSGPID